MIELKCPICKRTVKRKRPTKYCSKRCRNRVDGTDRCSCGRRKNKAAWQCRRCYKAPHDAEMLRAVEFYKTGATLAQTAKHLGCSVTGVVKKLARAGVPTRSNKKGNSRSTITEET
jgi:hypothetical protein